MLNKKIHHLSGFFGLLLLFVYTGYNEDKEQSKDRVLSDGASVQTVKKTVIQDLCWSPEGRYIYFSAMKVAADYSDYSPDLWTIYRFDTQGQSMVIIIRPALNVAVAPSGEVLALTMNFGGRKNIYLTDKNGLNPRTLVTGSVIISAPAWSPDGKKIAFVSTEDSAEVIYSVNIYGRDRIRLTDSSSYNAHNPAWSPDGKHIAYYLEKGDGMDQIYVMNADGSENRNITQDSYNNIFPGWTDSLTIIYGQGQEDGSIKAFQINIDGTEKKQVLQIESMYTRFSPDKSRIAYIDNAEGKIKIVSSSGEPIYEVSVPN